MSDAIAKTVSGSVSDASSADGIRPPGVRERLLRRALARLQVGRLHAVLPSGRRVTVDGVAP